MSAASPPTSEIPPHLRPHLYFAGACLAFKFVFRSLLKSIAIQGVSLVNFWYPLVATIACVHELRHTNYVSKNAQEARQIIDQKLSSSWSVDDNDNSEMVTVTTDDDSDDLEPKDKAVSACRYWFQYWSIYALAQTLDQILLLLFSLLFRDHIRLRNQLMAELNLFFSIYLFLMNTSLSFCYKWVKPHIVRGHLAVSEAISDESWTTMFASKTEQLLELMVTVHLLARPLKEQAVIVLRESRTLIVPAALTLLPLTPTFFTRLGVVYSQYLLPVGKATSTTASEAMQLHHLQYWILHSCVSILFEALSLFGWIPFYHHGMFIFWAYLSFDSTISEYYNILELDLISLGILPGDSKVEFHQTQTVQFLTAIAKRFPSADEAAFKELLKKGENEDGRSSPIEENHVPATEDRQAVAQLKSLIRQLPANDRNLDMDDDKTTQILEMLIHQLKKEEEKVVQEIEQTVSERVEKKVANTESRQDSPINDQWIDIIADELVTEMSTGGKSFSTKSTSDDDEIFYETERDLAEEDDLLAARRPAESLFVEERTSGQEKRGEKSQQGDPVSKEAKDKETRTNAFDGEIDGETKSEDFYDAKMPERRHKRERMSISKQSSSPSFVSRVMVRMESNQKAKRKEKRERLKEKKKEKMKKI